MRKCEKCNIVFNLDERSRCLYCNSLLLVVEPKESAEHEDSFSHEGFGSSEDHVISQIIRDRRQVAHDRKLYIVGSYFCTRTLHFMYCFSRNEMRMGRAHRRFLIQPFNMGSFLTIPWLVWNLLDSLFFRLIYNGYCEKCGWKYQKVSAKHGHDSRECEYCQEYTEIIRDILSGDILQSEHSFKEAGIAKVAANQHSAYKDLCTNRNFFSWVLDLACVWFSVSLLILFLVLVIFPPIAKGFHHLDDVGTMELR